MIRSFSQKVTPDSLKRPRSAKISSESTVSTPSSVFRGQITGPERVKSHRYLNHEDINQRAIQIFHTEEHENGVSESNSFQRGLGVIHPNNRVRRIFDATTVVWVLILVFFIPLEIGFDWYESPSGQKIFFLCLDAWFAIDIVLNFRTGYINHGTVVMDSKKIASNYLSTWFLVDVVGTVPFEQIISSHVSSRKSLKLVKYFKIPKLLRVSRVMKYVRNHKYVYDFSKVLILIFTLLHIGACVWVLILNPCDDSRTNFSGIDTCAQSNVFNVYAEALHLSAAMLLGVSNFHILGKPEILSLSFEGRPDDRTKMFLVSTFFMVVGLFLIALLMSEANVYVMGKMQGSAAFQRKTDRVNHEMEYYGVPDDLQAKVRAFYDYVWIHQKQYDDKIALLSDQQMSTDLQRKLALHLFEDVVSHISFFSEIDDLLLGEICMSLRTRIFLPRDMILFKGDVGKELFIISKGVVEVLRDDLPIGKRHNAPQILLRNGSFFGEIALVMEVRRTCSVQARTVCEVNILQQHAFDSVLRENPHFARRMNELVVARQLDSCLARSHQRGIDFKVSQTDLDLAVAAMEKNMKEGLERRQKKHSIRYIHSQCSAFPNEIVQKIAPPHGTRVSFADCEADRIAMPPKPPTQHSTKSNREPQMGQRKRNSDVDDVLKDITRRSTRFGDEDSHLVYLQKMHQLIDRPLSEQMMDEVSDSMDICSDGEIEATKERERIYRRRRTSSISTHTHSSKASKNSEQVAAEDDRLRGHFSPGRCIVDIEKVRPLIRKQSKEDDVNILNERLSRQGKIMEQLMDKIDRIEKRTKPTLMKNNANELKSGEKSSLFGEMENNNRRVSHPHPHGIPSQHNKKRPPTRNQI